MKKTISLLMLLVITTCSMAQVDSSKVAVAAPTSSTTFTYYFDGYYKGDFASKPENNKTSFTNSSNALLLVNGRHMLELNYWMLIQIETIV